MEKIIRNNTGVVLGKFIKKGCQSLFIIYATNSVVLLLSFSRISSEFHRHPPLSTKICLQSANPLRDPFAKYLSVLINDYLEIIIYAIYCPSFRWFVFVYNREARMCRFLIVGV